MGINTVDSFDIHTGIVDLRRTLDAAAKEHKAVSIISAGWDREATPSYAPCSKRLLRKESLTPTSVRV